MKQNAPMKRSTPMKRTAMVSKPKPPKGPKAVKCCVKECRKPFMLDPQRPYIRFCSPDCGTAVALEKLAKQKIAKAKSERAEAKREKLSNPSQKEREKLESLAQSLVNRCAVLRDWEDGCISCEKGPHWHGTWHGSHYKSVGSNSALRYNLFNISKACADCNWHRSGNIQNMVPRLRMKWGVDRLDWLDNHPRSREYSTEYLLRLCKIARRWIRRREKKLGIEK